MKQSKRRFRRLSPSGILILLGAVLIGAALVLVLYNVWDSNRAGAASDAALKKLETRIAEEKNAKDSSYTEDGSDTDGEMPTITIDGHAYIGEIEIPSMNLKLPVMADWSYPNLRIAPCRYTGSYETDDLVIVGHNYARHFSPLKWIQSGVDLYFTTVDGTRIHYQVEKRETVQPTSVKQMVENDKNSSESADWDLTLFTCNTGGQTRCAVRCVRVE